MTDATSATSATPTIVFVHGAWADASGAGYAGPSGPPGWRSIPSWYLVGTEDRAIPPAGQRFMAERGNAQIEEVAASHVSMVSQLEAVTRLILSAVEATSRSRG